MEQYECVHSLYITTFVRDTNNINSHYDKLRFVGVFQTPEVERVFIKPDGTPFRSPLSVSIELYVRSIMSTTTSFGSDNSEVRFTRVASGRSRTRKTSCVVPDRRVTYGQLYYEPMTPPRCIASTRASDTFNRRHRKCNASFCDCSASDVTCGRRPLTTDL